MAGRSVRLFLIDGTPQGMRTAEVGNWTGLALVSPRTDLARIGNRAESRRTGVYLLVGPSESSPSGLAIYVGEGDEVWSRLADHDAKKEFWTWVVMFVSKDDNLTKAHVRWLEAMLVRGIRKAKRAEVMNGNEPLGGKLPEADTADMEAFFDNVRLLLPTLGVSALDAQDAALAAGNAETALRLALRLDDVDAECLVVDGQFQVQPGSTARLSEGTSLGPGTSTLRQTLRTSGVLVPEGGVLRFTQAYPFDSPSGSAALIAGTSINGRIAWKVKSTGESYKDWLDRQVSAASADINVGAK